MHQKNQPSGWFFIYHFTMNTIKAQTFGGQILSAQLLGKELFYSPCQIVPPPTPTRGGIPVLFPQFNDRGPLTKHGFARTQEWQVFSMLEGCVSTSLLLTEQPNWPHRAQLNIDASIEDEHLEVHLEIRNVGDSDFEWTGGLHPYFLVDDVTQTRINGLNLNLSEQDLWNTEFTTSYPITNSVELHSPNINVRIEQKGFDSWMVWNPSAQHIFKDIPHEDWQKFVCVEPVCLTPTLIKAGTEWFGSMKITLV